MSSLLTRLETWTAKAETFDKAAARFREQGNDRDAEFAMVNAKTMRLLAVESGEMSAEQAEEVNRREYPDRDVPGHRVDA